MTVAIGFEVGAILPLFQARGMESGFRHDVSRDGSRFLVTSGFAPDLSPITLVTNWTAELPRK